MNNATACRWNRLRELEQPEHISSPLHELNQNDVAHVAEKFLVVNIDVLKLLVDLWRDRISFGLWLVTFRLLLLDELFGFILRHGGLGDATRHVLRLVHLAQLVYVVRADQLVLHHLSIFTRRCRCVRQ